MNPISGFGCSSPVQFAGRWNAGKIVKQVAHKDDPLALGVGAAVAVGSLLGAPILGSIPLIGSIGAAASSHPFISGTLASGAGVVYNHVASDDKKGGIE